MWEFDKLYYEKKKEKKLELDDHCESQYTFVVTL